MTLYLTEDYKYLSYIVQPTIYPSKQRCEEKIDKIELRMRRLDWYEIEKSELFLRVQHKESKNRQLYVCNKSYIDKDDILLLEDE